MMPLTPYYRGLFKRLGYPLTKQAGHPARILIANEKRLGVRIPSALREYYLVAGRERRFNTSHNRLLSPKDWSVERQKLVFMEENQRVLWWAVPTQRPQAVGDPPVFQGLNDEPVRWYSERRRCSVFLAVMLHLQAVWGGFNWLGSAEATENVHAILQQDWNYVGDMDQLWAFNRQNQVVCVTAGGNPIGPAMTLHAGGKTKADLRSIEESLSVTFE
jgi:hypothetical protein